MYTKCLESLTEQSYALLPYFKMLIPFQGRRLP